MLRNVTVICVFLLIIANNASTIANSVEDNKIPDEVRVILEKGEQFELLSLSPRFDKSANAFHGWKMLGKTAVKNSKAQDKLVAALKNGVAEHRGGPAFCFDPRHGIRVVHGGKTLDLVICFQCFQVRAFVGNDLIANFCIDPSPRPAFDAVLKEAKVPMP